MSEEKSWKNKYLKSIEEFEHLETDWKREREILQRGIAKVTIAAKGFDENLDQHLDLLRKNSRANNQNSYTALSTSINDLEKELVEIDERRHHKSGQIITSIKKLVDTIQSQTQDPTHIKKLKNLDLHIQRSIKNHLEPDTIKWLNLLSSLEISSGIIEKTPTNKPEKKSAKSIVDDVDNKNQKSSPPEKIKKNLWKKVFTFDKTAEDKTKGIKDQIKKDDLEDKKINSNEKKIQKNERYEEKIFEGTRQILRSFLSEIQPPHELKKSYKETQDKLDSNYKHNEFTTYLESIFHIALSTIIFHQNEFSGFLKHMEQSLDIINRSLVGSQSSHSKIQENNDSIDHEIRLQINNMSKDINDATNLETLKSSVQSNISRISQALDDFSEQQKSENQSLSEQLISLVDKVASMEEESEQVGQELELQRQRSYLDQLTQVPNRAAFEVRMQEEFSRWKRYGNPLSLIVCDVDHFKKINDNYGHLSGDKVLNVIGNLLAKNIRTIDFLARYGGEEFIILLPETKTEKAIQVADKIRVVISGLAFHFREEDVTITASFGITEFQKNDTPESAFERADKALYKAKENGRNRIET